MYATQRVATVAITEMCNRKCSNLRKRWCSR